MRFLVSLLTLMFVAPAFAGDGPDDDGHGGNGGLAHKSFVVERTFPPGALAALDTPVAKRSIVLKNQISGVTWLYSYVNADRTRTFDLYQGPNTVAVIKASQLNRLPIDRVLETPVRLEPRVPPQPGENRRFMVSQTIAPGEAPAFEADAMAQAEQINSLFGVFWKSSFVNVEGTSSYSLYDAPTANELRDALIANGFPVGTITETSGTILPPAN